MLLIIDKEDFRNSEDFERIGDLPHQTQSSRRPSRKIKSGTNSLPKEFPYQVSLQAFNYETQSYVPICGGVILDEVTVLTAAHCVKYDFRGFDEDFRIVAGEIVLSQVEDSKNAQKVSVQSYLRHPGWDSFQKLNDIGLLVLRSPLEFNEHVFPIKLPQSTKYEIPHEGNFINLRAYTKHGWELI